MTISTNPQLAMIVKGVRVVLTPTISVDTTKHGIPMTDESIVKATSLARVATHTIEIVLYRVSIGPMIAINQSNVAISEIVAAINEMLDRMKEKMLTGMRVRFCGEVWYVEDLVFDVDNMLVKARIEQ